MMANLYFKMIRKMIVVIIENIISNALEASETIRPTPSLPKNPYNGETFKCYELKILYDFLLTFFYSFKKGYSCLSKFLRQLIE